MKGGTDVLHFILQEPRSTDPKYLEEETNDHTFFSRFVMVREIVDKILFVSFFVHEEHRAIWIKV